MLTGHRLYTFIFSLTAIVAIATIPLTAIAEPVAGSLSASIRDRLEGPAADAIDFSDREALKAFYATRDYGALWVDQTGPTRSGARAIEELSKAGSWGLDGAALAPKAAVAPMVNGRWTPDDAAAADVEVSALIIAYARQAKGGRIPDPSSQLTTYLDRTPRIADPAVVMTEAALARDAGAYLLSLHPKHEQFMKLRNFYVRLLDERTRQQEMSIALRGAELRPGERYPEIANLRRRFGVAADAGADELIYDQQLEAAVRQFQKALSLKVDGVVGNGTRKALNVNVADRTAAVLANMEQWRWMPDDLGATHVFVNIPSYSVEFYRNGALAFRDRVIVGKQATQTPIFSHNMSTVVLRPEWILPDSIKVKRLMSGRALESQGLRVKRNGKTISSSKVNWGKVDLSVYTVYQPSGGGNALGAVKFLFPNKHSVYLHDTPDKYLFESSERNFSAGCVRVKNPLLLAQQILDADGGDGAFDVAKLTKSGPSNNEITLQKRIPVHIANFTVWIGDDGKPTYLPDRYGHQKRITLALAERWKEIDRGKNHLAAVDTSALEGLSLRSGKSKPKKEDELLEGPVGLTKSYSTSFGGYKSPGGGVGDIIRRAFMGQ